MSMNTEENTLKVASPAGDLINIINELGDNGDLQSISSRLGMLLVGLRGDVPVEPVEPSDSPESVLAAASLAVRKKHELFGKVSSQLDELESLLRV